MMFGGRKTVVNIDTPNTSVTSSPVVKKEFKFNQNTSSFLLMYNNPPDYTIEFDNFASLALERFSVLQMVENVGTRHMKGSNDYLNKLDAELRKIGFIKSILINPKDGVEEGDVTKDITSHFILRLAFCQTDELKRWFIQQEVDLFRYKLQKAATEPHIIQKFLTDNQLSYIPISESEKQGVSENLVEMGFSHTQINSQDFYKVNFLEVLELVKARRVLLKGGYAYVTINDFGSVLSHVFRTRLSKNLSNLGRHIREIEDDERLSELFRILRERDVSNNYADTPKDTISADSLDHLSIKSFPLCMRHLHESLKQYHHLKHYGRLQYNLFLKGIGLPVEESLKFFKGEFSRGSISVDRVILEKNLKNGTNFEKEYAYNIRHSYGKEGKRTSYTPYSCLKIITSHMPGPGDHHGCPFKHFEKEFLKQKLKQFGRGEEETGQILEHVENSNYQIACQRYFELSHKTDEIVPVNHPNQYFEQSKRILNGNKPITRGPTNKIEHIKVEMTQ